MKIRFLTPAEIEMFEASVYYEMQAYDLGLTFVVDVYNMQHVYTFIRGRC